MLIKDAKPQVGIFEIVDNNILIDSEDVDINYQGEYFDGHTPHLHANDIKVHVEANPYISQDTQDFFRSNPNAYLYYPRGRVDYNTKDGTYHIMAAKKFFTQLSVEQITREFHLPPYASGKIVLEADDGHYGY